MGRVSGNVGKVLKKISIWDSKPPLFMHSNYLFLLTVKATPWLLATCAAVSIVLSFEDCPFI